MKNSFFLLLLSLVFVTACQSSPPTSNNYEPPMNATNTELLIEDLYEGEGRVSEDGDLLVVHYTGTLEDGTKFNSSLDRGEPFEFVIGQGYVIQGWDEGMLGMKIGGKRKLTIPSDMAYGDRGVPGAIPGGATLIFEVELLEIK